MVHSLIDPQSLQTEYIRQRSLQAALQADNSSKIQKYAQLVQQQYAQNPRIHNAALPALAAGLAAFGGGAGVYYAASKYNQALRYAASTPSRTFGTASLMYPNKSSVFRRILGQAKSGVKVGLAATLVLAEFEALVNEVAVMRRGGCQ